MDLKNKEIDERIRTALKRADAQGKLSVVAAVTGLSKTKLKEVMNGTGELSHVDRAMLGIHLSA